MKNKKEDLYSIESDIDNYDNLKNGWLYYINQRNNDKYKMGRRIQHNKDKSNPRICPKCDFVWAREYVSRTMNARLLVDFPRYGLKKAVCYFCVPYEKQDIDD